MRLDELTYDERMVLGGLVRMMLRADGQFSDGEKRAIEQIGARIADDPVHFRRAIVDSAKAFGDDDAIFAAARKVERGEARLMIRSVLEEIATADLTEEAEHNLLLWLQEQWD